MGPRWLGDELAWTKQPEITETKEASVETVQQKEEKLIFEQDHHNERKEWTESFLSKYKCWRLFRITAFVLRFVGNCRRQEKQSGPLTTEELKKPEDVWLKVAQRDEEMESHMELKVENVGLWRCSGRAPDYHPIFIPRKHLLAILIIERCHEETLHGGVQEFEGRAITPNILLIGELATFLEENTETSEEEGQVTRRLRYLNKCRK